MKIEAKIKELLERASAAPAGQDPMQSLPGSESQDLGSERDGENASTAAGKAAAPGGEKGGETAPVVTPGSTPPNASDEEELDDKAPGKSATANANKMSAPGGEKAGETTPVVTPGSTPPTGVTEEEQKEIYAVLEEAGIEEASRVKLVEAFEAAVQSRVEAELDESATAIAESITELVEEKKAELFEQVNAFLDYVVEGWMEKNALAIEAGLRNDIIESFIGGLKDLFETHYIEVPEAKYDVVAQQQAKIDELTKQVNESVSKTVELSQEVNSLKRCQIVERAASDMVATDKEKFSKLCEDVEFEGEEGFADKVKQLKERFFAPSNSSKSTLSEDAGEEGNAPTIIDNPIVDAVAKALTKSSKFGKI